MQCGSGTRPLPAVGSAGELLDELVEVGGYNRKHAITLMNKQYTRPTRRKKRPGRPRSYQYRLPSQVPVDKTALMVGRVALLLADGVEPDSIAAITFTELAATELAERIRSMCERLLQGQVPIELRDALPDGLTPARLATLRLGVDRSTT